MGGDDKPSYLCRAARTNPRGRAQVGTAYSVTVGQDRWWRGLLLPGEIRPAVTQRLLGPDAMTETTARGLIQAHFDASNVGVAGGGAEDDIARASEIYADDAVVEWPQGGERLRGKANIVGFRSTYPPASGSSSTAPPVATTYGSTSTRSTTTTTVMAVGIMEFRDDKVVRERIYFGDAWEPPAWRASGSSGSTPGSSPDGIRTGGS